MALGSRRWPSAVWQPSCFCPAQEVIGWCRKPWKFVGLKRLESLRGGGASGQGGRFVAGNSMGTQVLSPTNDQDRNDGGQPPRSVLIVRKPFSDYLVDGTNIWELHGQRTLKRERMSIVEQGSGLLVGDVDLLACRRIARTDDSGTWVAAEKPELFPWNVAKNCVQGRSQLGQPGRKELFAWVVERPHRYQWPKPAKRSSQVTWITLPETSRKDPTAGEACGAHCDLGRQLPTEKTTSYIQSDGFVA